MKDKMIRKSNTGIIKKSILLGLVVLGTSGCSTYMVDFWDGLKTVLRTANYKSKVLLGSDAESRAVSSTGEFFGENEMDFIPLDDKDLKSQFIDIAIPQSKEIPGKPGGKIPGIEAFRSPPTSLAATFTKIYFNTDQHTPKSKEALQSIHRIGAYLRKHPQTYVFIEGHCDKRAGEAYNLSLGTRRSNYVRNLLVKQGVNPDQLFTVSFGKEKPEDLRDNEQGWAKNRRVAFKIYEKRTTL
jgi:peptidoglycan-associated lipoprotein